MNVRTESRILLSALLALPLIAGIVILFAGGNALLYGLLLLGLSLAGLIFVWWPRRGPEHKDKN